MKRAIICAICGKAKKYSESYALKIQDFRLYSDFMQDPMFKVEENGKVEQITGNFKVRACRACIRKMGYKVKKVKGVKSENKK
jgi:hypothetical protein